MTTFKDYIKQHRGIDMPEGDISMDWFEENHLPMIVECIYCGTTMAAPDAMVDDDEYLCCKSCAE